MPEVGFILCSHNYPHKEHQRMIPSWIINITAIIIVLDNDSEK